jgi:phenylalanyl-tRNA synthetase alpha chain
MENDWHNFDALNMNIDHPARQQHDTFYIHRTGENINDNEYSVNSKPSLLRTHTSSMQIRHMLCNKAPQRIASIGKVYRSDYDSTHTPMFHQMEILCIDKDTNMAQLKFLISKILSMYFNMDDIKIRFRSSYFPFTEPSIEVDIHGHFNDDKKFTISSNKLSEEKGKWIEVLGAGMVHRNVLKNMNVPTEYKGFAMGLGIERIAMFKHCIDDLRSFYDTYYQAESLL